MMKDTLLVIGIIPTMNDSEVTENNSEESCNLPIYGVEYADGSLVPFGDLYLDLFPEQYTVE